MILHQAQALKLTSGTGSSRPQKSCPTARCSATFLTLAAEQVK
jgi:hypothetical protein